MTQILLPKNKHIKITDDVQVSPTGQKFRLSGLKRDDMNWVYIFRYLDNGFFEVTTDPMGNFIKLEIL